MDEKIKITIEDIFFDDELPLHGERAIKGVTQNEDTYHVTLAVDPQNSPQTRFDMEDRIREALQKTIGSKKVRVSTVALFEAPSDSANKKEHDNKSKTADLPPRERLPGVKEIHLVCSAKGGVGKSTVSLNTALALHKKGHKVGLLDLDFYGPSLPSLIGAELTPLVIGDRIMPPEIHGLAVLSIGMLMDKSQPLIWRGPMVASVLRQLLFEVDWTGLDYLIVDMPPGTGDTYISMLQSVEIDGVVIVTTPSELSLADVSRGIGVFTPFNAPIIGIVENMATYSWPLADDALDTIRSIKAQDELTASKLKRLESLIESSKDQKIFGDNTKKCIEELELPLITSLPLDAQLQKHNDSGTPYMLNPMNAALMRAFLKVADAIENKKA